MCNFKQQWPLAIIPWWRPLSSSIKRYVILKFHAAAADIIIYYILFFLFKSNFSFQLSSLYEIKPPISKAKMTAITKGAIKAIKYYKHVVQSVEKFIQKCRPEYKIPGLYVIDSIARQSRHQFGPTKDVFAPRFAKNVQITFWHLYKCPEEEKVRSRKYSSSCWNFTKFFYAWIILWNCNIHFLVKISEIDSCCNFMKIFVSRSCIYS